MDFFDRVSLTGVRETGDGYLVAEARIARTGIQVYRGFECGKDTLDTVKVYRPETEVFSAPTLTSCAYRPMTNDHPSERVTSKNWKKFSVGITGPEVARDG